MRRAHEALQLQQHRAAHNRKHPRPLRERLKHLHNPALRQGDFADPLRLQQIQERAGAL